MAIKGISDVKVLPRLAKIRTGIKKKNSNPNKRDFPDEVEYFVLNPMEEVRDKIGNVVGTRANEHIEALIQMFGEKPVEFPIMLPVDDLTLVADPWMKWWTGDVEKRKSTLKCRGDGEYAFYKGQERVSGLDGEIPDHRRAEGYNRICNKDLCPQAMKGDCKPNMNLRFLIPSYTKFGVFQIDTTSSQAMTAILSSLDVARKALMQEGITSLVGVPLRLYRERRSNQHKNVNYILKVEVDIKELKHQKQLHLDHKPSSLTMALDHYKVESFLEEPNYDLLPQSEHGAYQTGDEEVVVTAELPPPIDKTKWIEDNSIKEKFAALAALKGQLLTDARMQATADKFETKEELIAYIDKGLEQGSKA